MKAGAGGRRRRIVVGGVNAMAGATRKLEPGDLFTLEEYARRRNELRREAVREKRRRELQLGEHARLFFESRVTMRYQVQEMLRIERIFEPEAIGAELAAYNPLIPDGDNWKATLMLEYPDPVVRRRELARLAGVERCVWARIGAAERVYAIADEDLDRSDPGRTSAVHFLRFQLDGDMCAAARQGAPLALGIDHAHLDVCVRQLPPDLCAALRGDLSPAS